MTDASMPAESRITVLLPRAVQARNHLLDQYLRRRFGVTLHVYKLIKAVTDLAAVALAFYAIQAGLEPVNALLFVAFVLGGWEMVEVLALRDNATARARDGDRDE